MPYKSKKQAAYFHAAEKQGKISKDTVDKWDMATKAAGVKLPEYADKLHKNLKSKSVKDTDKDGE